MAIEIELKLTRIETQEAETSFKFPLEDAKGFPNALPDARKIGLGRRSLTGLMTSSEKVSGSGAFESSLERDYYVLLEFDPTVSAWHPQSVEVPGVVMEGAPQLRYFPDVAVERTLIGPDGPMQAVTLVEVKHRSDIQQDWPNLKRKFKACRAYARERGWRFEIMTEVEIRTPHLANAKFLLPYQRRRVGWDDQAKVLEAARKLGPCSAEALLASLSDCIWEKGMLLPVVWYLVATRALRVNLSERVTMSTLISPNG